MSSDEITANLQQQLTNVRREIQNLRKQLNTLQHVHRKEIDRITRTLENFRCNECKNKQDQSQAPSTSFVQNDFVFKPIGVISSEFPQLRGTPRQPTITPATATLSLNKDVFTNPGHALQDLQHFSHLWIIFAFHKNCEHPKAKVAPPRLNGERTGVFATRSPHRPCPIGLSLVKIESIVDNVVCFTGVDMIDQTPVFDIKPYIPHYDQPALAFQQTHLSAQEILGTRVELVLDRCEVLDESSDSVLAQASTSRGITSTRADFCDRGDPDGAEDLPEDASSQAGAPPGDVRVPAWIDQAPVHRLSVSFHDVALAQLHELEPQLAEEKSRIISNVLREDPRSVYLREKWSSTYYIWRIDSLCVACKFNDADHSVEIVKIFRNT